uniref:Uncharacterized protein n=1 Tax=Glossina austeni TaxID=7395 RepID=A0A1A9VT21_GLOAU
MISNIVELGRAYYDTDTKLLVSVRKHEGGAGNAAILRKIGNEKHQTGNKITRKLSTDSQNFSRKRIFTQHVNYTSDLNDKKNNNKNNSNNANSHNNIKKVGRHFDRLPAGYELEHRRTYKSSNEKN